MAAAERYFRRHGRSIRIGLGWILLASGLGFWPGQIAWPQDQAGRITFQGNDRIHEQQLREAASGELERLAASNFPISLAAQAAEKMEALYLSQGYFFATVEAEPTYEPLPGMRFSVDEGPRVEVSAVRFEGNRFFSQDRLANLFSGLRQGFLGLGPRILSPEQVQAGVEAVESLYESEGFAEVSVAGPRYRFSDDQQQVTLTFGIQEGPRFIIQGLEARGDFLPAACQVMNALAGEFSGQPLNNQRREILQRRLREVYGRAGFPDALADLNSRPAEEAQRVILTAEMFPGPRVTVSRVEVEGNTETRAAFIASRVAQETGARFDLAKIGESYRRLTATGLFQKVDLRLEGQGEERALVVGVEEAPLRGFSLDVSGNTYDYLRGEGRYEDKHLFGSPLRLRTGASLSFKSAGAYATLLDPWLLYPSLRDWAGELRLYFLRRDEPAYLRHEYGGRLGVNHSPAAWLNVTAAYELAQNDLLTIRADPAQPETPDRYRAASLLLRAEADTRDQPFFPTTGERAFLSLEGSHPAVGSSLIYGRLSGEAAFYWSLGPTTVVAGRYGTGLVVPGEGQEFLPVSERFFLGGEFSVRSFNRDQLGPTDRQGDPEGGLGYNLFNLEIRQKLFDIIAVYGFYDLGNIAPQRTRDDAGQPLFADRNALLRATYAQFYSGFSSGLGGGVAVLLPIGPLRVDLAFNPRPRENEAATRVLFSLGTAF